MHQHQEDLQVIEETEKYFFGLRSRTRRTEIISSRMVELSQNGLPPNGSWWQYMREKEHVLDRWLTRVRREIQQAFVQHNIPWQNQKPTTLKQACEQISKIQSEFEMRLAGKGGKGSL